MMKKKWHLEKWERAVWLEFVFDLQKMVLFFPLGMVASDPVAFLVPYFWHEIVTIERVAAASFLDLVEIEEMQVVATILHRHLLDLFSCHVLQEYQPLLPLTWGHENPRRRHYFLHFPHYAIQLTIDKPVVVH